MDLAGFLFSILILRMNGKTGICPEPFRSGVRL
jgi:hypothetical protein